MYYVYVHINPITKQPFYVGKGKGRRSNTANGRNDEWLKTVKDLNGDYDTKIIKEHLTETEAFDLENEKIEEYGLKKDGGTLVNKINSPGYYRTFAGWIKLNFNLSSEPNDEESGIISDRLHMANEIEIEIQRNISNKKTPVSSLTNKQKSKVINEICLRFNDWVTQNKYLPKDSLDISMGNNPMKFLDDDYIPQVIEAYKNNKIDDESFYHFFNNELIGLKIRIEKVSSSYTNDKLIKLGRDIITYCDNILNRNFLKTIT